MVMTLGARSAENEPPRPPPPPQQAPPPPQQAPQRPQGQQDSPKDFVCVKPYDRQSASNKERINNHVNAYDQGKWVRDAAIAYSEKHNNI